MKMEWQVPNQVLRFEAECEADLEMICGLYIGVQGPSPLRRGDLALEMREVPAGTTAGLTSGGLRGQPLKQAQALTWTRVPAGDSAVADAGEQVVSAPQQLFRVTAAQR